MGNCRLALAVFAAVCFVIAAHPSPGHAQAPTLSVMKPGAAAFPLERVGFMHHRKRKYAFYCYPRNYWWFYRPYTTAKYDYARCMPYFHYPSRGAGGGSGYAK